MIFYLHIISNYIHDGLKSEAWRLWERRITWRSCTGFYGDFESAYKTLRLIERVRINTLCYKVTK